MRYRMIPLNGCDGNHSACVFQVVQGQKLDAIQVEDRAISLTGAAVLYYFDSNCDRNVWIAKAHKKIALWANDKFEMNNAIREADEIIRQAVSSYDRSHMGSYQFKEHVDEWENRVASWRKKYIPEREPVSLGDHIFEV